MTRSSRTRRRLLALAAPAVLLVTACGGDDGGADDTTAVSEAPEDTGGDTSEPTETSASGSDTTEATETSGATGDGFEFTSPEGDYTAVFPAEPATSEQQAPTADGRTLPVTQHIAEDEDGASFATAELAIPEGEPYDMEAGRDGSVSAVGGELISSEEIDVQGREGVEFVASVESNGITGTYVSRILTDGETVYQLIVVAPGELSATDADVAAFFDSFAFTS